MQLRLGRQSDKGLQFFTLPSLFGVIRDRIHGFVCLRIGTNRMPSCVDGDPELAEVIAPHHCHIGQRPCSSWCEFPDRVCNAEGCPHSSVLSRRPTNCGCRYLRHPKMINKDPNALEANHNIASLQLRHIGAISSLPSSVVAHLDPDRKGNAGTSTSSAQERVPSLAKMRPIELICTA